MGRAGEAGDYRRVRRPHRAEPQGRRRARQVRRQGELHRRLEVSQSCRDKKRVLSCVGLRRKVLGLHTIGYVSLLSDACGGMLLVCPLLARFWPFHPQATLLFFSDELPVRNSYNFFRTLFRTLLYTSISVPPTTTYHHHHQHQQQYHNRTHPYDPIHLGTTTGSRRGCPSAWRSARATSRASRP